VLAQYPLSEQTRNLIEELLAEEQQTPHPPALAANAATTAAVAAVVSLSSSMIDSSFEDCGECIISSKETAKTPILSTPAPLFPATPFTTPGYQIGTPAAVLNSSDETDESDLEIDSQQLLYSSTPSATPLKDRSFGSSNHLPNPLKPNKPPSKSTSSAKLKSSSSPAVLGSISSPLASSPATPVTKISFHSPPLVEEVKVTSSSIKRKQQELFQVDTVQPKKKSSNMSPGGRKKKKKLSDIDDIFGDLG
jgi:hypothetical protein